MKEQDKTSEAQLSDMEVGSLPEKEFRVTVNRIQSLESMGAWSGKLQKKKKKLIKT